MGDHLFEDTIKEKTQAGAQPLGLLPFVHFQNRLT